MEPGRTEDVARACVKTLGVVPAGRFAGTAGDVKPADRRARRGGAKGGGRKSASEVADDATGSGSEHGAGVCADDRRREPLSTGQAGGQLSGTDSARGQFWGSAEDGQHQQTGQSHAAQLAGGGGADRSAV